MAIPPYKVRTAQRVSRLTRTRQRVEKWWGKWLILWTKVLHHAAFLPIFLKPYTVAIARRIQIPSGFVITVWALVIWLTLLLCWGKYGFFAYLRLQQQTHTLDEKVKALQQQQRLLHNEIPALQKDQDYLEHLARTRLGVIAPSDRILPLPPKESR